MLRVDLHNNFFCLEDLINSILSHPQQVSNFLVRPIRMSPCHRHHQPSPLLLLEWRLGSVSVRFGCYIQCVCFCAQVAVEVLHEALVIHRPMSTDVGEDFLLTWGYGGLG